MAATHLLKTPADARPARRTPVRAARKTEEAADALPAVDTGTLRITHPERIIDPQSGVTKLDLIHFYARVAPLMLPHLKARPTSLVRAPEGVAGPLFFQKHSGATEIHGIRLLNPKFDPGHESLLEITTAEALLGAAQVNVVEFHTWNATTRTIGKPDRMTFDLDPGEGVSWEQMQEGTELVHVFLQELGLPSFLKTSGGKGMHIVVPLKPSLDWETVRKFSQAIVQHLSQTVPARFVAKSGPANRVGKIFIDYLRNGFGATTVSAWSVRARPGMGVSVPVGWDELTGLASSAHWTAATIAERLPTGDTPWADYEMSRTTLTAAMKTLGFAPAASRKR